ncbi:menaquinone-dependent protoporphyrinogen IX dehydrogenase [Photobacterium iliopiscarium]|uniref:menaquinone-dependent protoporphyrinogen IX dehydrogenase n=1 Tax=Photobacterium iliopiscarium TaxID=56192 RepID=UPI000D172B46|nr:menaquinone-dependent protoporphyrinogen IX dehydrogenase [Photobacterium iliopiscarium]PST88520.1 menaquinone-dependent protoporphyrinogen IX dehydrogenase [Photobacterium iliopiscarium]
MEKVLLLHSSCEGQTIKILNHIEQNLGEQYQCDYVDIHLEPKIDFSAYDRVLVGASVRYGHLNKKLYQFIARNLISLEQAKVAFFCVNLTARKEGKDTPATSAYIKKFLLKSPWHPKMMAVFAGALRYPRYNFFDRTMIKLIMKLTDGETDTTKEVEYTDWHKVSHFSQQFKTL